MDPKTEPCGTPDNTGLLSEFDSFKRTDWDLLYIEDICFFEVNTKYISSRESKTSEFLRKFSRVRSTSEDFYDFNSRDEIYLIFTGKKKQILFLFNTIHRHFPIHKTGGENAKTKNKNKTQIILEPHCSLRSN